MAETILSTGTTPTSNAEAGLDVATSISGNNVLSVGVGAGGTITITYNTADANISGQTIIMTPSTASGGSVEWDCTGGTVVDRYRPANCR